MTARIGQLDVQAARRALRTDGLRVATGPFNCSLRTDVDEIAPALLQLYAHHPTVPAGDMIDLHVEVAGGRGLRRWVRPQAHFRVDDVSPFTPLPRAQALPMLEWGLNWCITAYFHHLLVLHAACLARDGQALILPAPPGSGKSTLCAALAQRGWRLLSDELTLVDPRSLRILALARPVSLKNASIDVIRRFEPHAWLTAPVHDTAKGTVALMAPPPASVVAMHQPATARWLVLPRYVPEAPAVLEPMPPAEAFMQIADNAMNYHILGRAGFDAVGALTHACSHHRFSYSRLDDAIRVFDDLARAG